MEQAQTSRQVLDRKEILERLENDDRLLVKVVDMYLAQVPEQVEDIRRALAGRDGQALDRAAHKLKGSVGYFGARDATAAALRLEELGRQGDFAAAEEAMTRLDAELARLGAALVDLKRDSSA